MSKYFSFLKKKKTLVPEEEHDNIADKVRKVKKRHLIKSKPEQRHSMHDSLNKTDRDPPTVISPAKSTLDLHSDSDSLLDHLDRIEVGIIPDFVTKQRKTRRFIIEDSTSDSSNSSCDDESNLNADSIDEGFAYENICNEVPREEEAPLIIEDGDASHSSNDIDDFMDEALGDLEEDSRDDTKQLIGDVVDEKSLSDDSYLDIIFSLSSDNKVKYELVRVQNSVDPSSETSLVDQENEPDKLVDVVHPTDLSIAKNICDQENIPSHSTGSSLSQLPSCDNRSSQRQDTSSQSYNVQSNLSDPISARYLPPNDDKEGGRFGVSAPLMEEVYELANNLVCQSLIDAIVRVSESQHLPISFDDSSIITNETNSSCISTNGPSSLDSSQSFITENTNLSLGEINCRFCQTTETDTCSNCFKASAVDISFTNQNLSDEVYKNCKSSDNSVNYHNASGHIKNNQDSNSVFNNSNIVDNHSLHLNSSFSDSESPNQSNNASSSHNLSDDASDKNDTSDYVSKHYDPCIYALNNRIQNDDAYSNHGSTVDALSNPKSTDDTAVDQNITDDTSVDQHTTDDTSVDQNTTDDTSVDQNTTADTSVDQNTTDDNSVDQNTTDDNSVDQNTTDDTSVDHTSDDNALSIHKSRDDDALSIHKSRDNDALSIHKSDDALSIHKSRDDDALRVHKSMDDDALSIQKSRDDDALSIHKSRDAASNYYISCDDTLSSHITCDDDLSNNIHAIDDAVNESPHDNASNNQDTGDDTISNKCTSDDVSNDQYAKIITSNNQNTGNFASNNQNREDLASIPSNNQNSKDLTYNNQTIENDVPNNQNTTDTTLYDQNTKFGGNLANQSIGSIMLELSKENNLDAMVSSTESFCCVTQSDSSCYVDVVSEVGSHPICCRSNERSISFTTSNEIDDEFDSAQEELTDDEQDVNSTKSSHERFNNNNDRLAVLDMSNNYKSEENIHGLASQELNLKETNINEVCDNIDKLPNQIAVSEHLRIEEQSLTSSEDKFNCVENKYEKLVDDKNEQLGNISIEKEEKKFEEEISLKEEMIEEGSLISKHENQSKSLLLKEKRTELLPVVELEEQNTTALGLVLETVYRGRRKSLIEQVDINGNNSKMSLTKKTSSSLSEDNFLMHSVNNEFDEAEARLAQRRAARAEARELRLRELEKQQKEHENEEEQQYAANATPNLVPESPVRVRVPSTGGRSSAARSSVSNSAGSFSRRSSVDSDNDPREIKAELKEAEEKFRKAMITNAQLDNEKATLTYEVDFLKDKYSELEETHIQLKKEHKKKCCENEQLRKLTNKLKEEVKIVRKILQERDALIQEYGLVLIGEENGEEENNSLYDAEMEDDTCYDLSPRKLAIKKALLTQEASDLLAKGAAKGSLDVRLKKYAEDKNDLEDEVRRLRLEIEEQYNDRRKENGIDYEKQKEASKSINEYKFRVQKAEAEVNTLQANVLRLESLTTRYKASAEELEQSEEELKAEKRRLQRELRDTQNLLEEFELKNSLMEKRFNKMRNAKSMLLKDLSQEPV